MSYEFRKFKPREELPTFDPATQTGEKPKQLNETRKSAGVLYVAGAGSKTAKVMFIMPALQEDDAQEDMGNGSFRIPNKPRYLKSAAGGLFKDLLEQTGLPVQEQYVTAICKWLLPKAQRGKPKATAIAWADDLLDQEIRDINPQIIVCLGKTVFDHLFPLKLKLGEIAGGWFHCEKYNCRLYPMDDIMKPLLKPEYIDKFRIDLIEVKKMLDLCNGVAAPKIEQRYQVIANSSQLLQLVTKLFTERRTTLSVDCEWGGNHHVDGKLRSLQICWAPGEAAYIRFMDETCQYTFDVDYRQAGTILGMWLNQPQVRYIGHQLTADMAWMSHTLGLEIYRKSAWDTLYAAQVIDENQEGKLERLAMAYTDLGRYDIELTIWKKENHLGEDEGYGRIPDSILIPYACLRAHSLVQLGDGSWRQIRDLVKERYSGTVKALLDGEVQNCRVTNWYRADVDQKEWYRIITPSTRGCRWGVRGPVFTPDHKVITRRGKVRVDELVLDKDEIATPERCATVDQLSIILASLLGDGGFSERNNNGTGFRFSQTRDRAAYVDWKAESLASLGTAERVISKRQVCYDLPFSRYFKFLKDRMPRQPASIHARRKLVITEDVLNLLGPLGWAVWYQDDGVFTKDTQVRIACKASEQERSLVIDWLTQRFGPGVGYYTSQRCFYMNKDAGARFLAFINPYMHPVFSYKTNLKVGPPPKVDSNGELFYEQVVSIEPVRNRKEAGDGVRYCLSVERAENFLTEVGFVSNCRDVDAVMRMYPMQVAQMRLQGEGLLDYYLNLFLPFVTDIFCNFTLVGLPMDLERLTKLRTMYLLARDRLQERFQERIKQEARKLFVIQLGKLDAIGGITAFHAIDAALKAGESAQAMELFKAFTPPEKFGRLLPFYEHFVDAPAFNIRSVNQMKRWLYDVKGFTPIKSTNNKEKGLPSMDWSKVMTLPENSRKEISPSCDKQTLKVLAEQDSLVMELLGLNAVGNLTKAFLRPAELDDEGNLVKENGLHFWVASDGRVHGQFATTETGRPRSWKPNSLNWPSWVTSQISDAILRLVQEEPEDSDFRRAYVDLVGNPRDEKGKLVPPPSIRSCISAQAIQGAQEEGWCLVESDYQTAEVRGLAYISGDENLIRLINEDDVQFGAIAGGDLEKDRVRLCYAPDYGIATEHQNPEFILALAQDGKVVKRITDAELHRRPDGSIWHPKHDLHWNLAEMSLQRPREVLHKKKHRDGLGKTGNFKSAYGSSPGTMERSIEAETGQKPEEGTGQKILDTLAKRQPVADAFLKALELVPDNSRRMTAASGRVRHFRPHDSMSSVGKRIRDKVLSALSREARNFYMQESVAATSARAAIWMNEFCRKHGLKARIITVLYDSVVTLCPLSERFAVQILHQLYMTDVNAWTYHGRELTYPIDTEFNYRWSCRPSKAEQKKLDDPKWNHNEALTAMVSAFAEETRKQHRAKAA